MSSPSTEVSVALSERIMWASQALARLVETARARGWLAGTAPTAITTPSPGLPPRRVPAEWLRTRLDLSSNQHDALWLLACVDLEPALSRLAAAFATPECPDLSVQTLQQVLLCAGSEGLSEDMLAELVDLGLIETTADHRLPTYRRWVRASDRFIELAKGNIGLAAEVARFARLEFLDEDTARCELPEALVNALGPRRESPLVVAVGSEGTGRATLLGNVAARCGLGTLRFAASALSRDRDALTRQLRGVVRECSLFGVVPLIEGLDGSTTDESRTDLFAILDRELLGAFTGPVLASASEHRQRPLARPVITYQMPALSEAQRAAVWRRALPSAPGEVIAVAAARYAIAPGAIVAAAETAVIDAGDNELTSDNILTGVRTHVDQRLGSFARRIETAQGWEDLVLPASEFEQIIELVARVRHKSQVLDRWGFAEKIGRGFGLSALMSGPPGTGKTMVAGLIANELGLDLYQVDLSKVVSKYIGETEKNLAAAFDAAESGHAILLFDEADALFARRSEVKSSNDRYANLEVNYLLQRLEAFTGIVLLTTNHETAIDEAFRRRLAMHIRFPQPDDRQRENLWRAMLPAKAAVGDDIDYRRLGHDFAMSGGYIKNAAVRAAYLAADAGVAISMTQLCRAARAEYEGMGKIYAVSR